MLEQSGEGKHYLSFNYPSIIFSLSAYLTHETIFSLSFLGLLGRTVYQAWMLTFHCFN